MSPIEILLLLVKALGWEDTVANVVINLLPAESAFDALMNTGINLWGIFSSSISFFGTMILITLIFLAIIVAIAPPNSIWFIKPYGGMYSFPGLTTVMPGLNRYLVDPQQKMATWLVNVITKPWIFIIASQLSMAIAGLLLVDRAFISDLLTSLFASPLSSVTMVTGTLFWVTLILSATSFVMVAGLFLYPVIELGNAFGNPITEWMEEMMYASLVIAPLVAFLYRIAFMMKAEGNPVTGIVMWLAAVFVPIVIVMGGLMKALIKIAIDVIIMYVLKGLGGKGFLGGAQLQKLFAANAVLNRVTPKSADQSPHRTGLPTRLLKTPR